ncbi:hypothetical protein AJ85_06955 [Alkalihalobacillus alcalophilus ATCC 27647 = CGMCC 1.3604]|uniref:DUF4871 domain-containing protein n=1 Tax=Alkalihalobacillus alcalophilus ATCC 27647 = CGMCC 1.3604 TaxID=1218173 RepID=A0A094WCW6_ALKAL|nr:DUF4871 domain-containing protein [Alkalihalobacillus alcalophilus]KGA95619.1 hypothetical protein BALCAV_0221290 [Alkalihalobacillus alcalophilus ATCC 27647 = CGMCC 1.3604]MED1564167.1 DUF4871 domain-containing protein [Alkalihalobacillus alcalophilus]THG91105.1 hypothetical protein AJ85_06955 [Alkalihalobacillus alcalophilus ATCC 27647 = CGMCC 1.3604]
MIKKSKFMFIIFVLLAAFSACSANDETIEEKTKDIEVSSIFNSGSYSMIGEEKKIGFIYDEYSTPFIAGEENKYMWHFWGENLEMKPLKVIGTNTETNQEVVVIEEGFLAGPNNEADAHMPSLMSLPTKGIWTLDAYIGEELFGTIVVKAR